MSAAAILIFLFLVLLGVRSVYVKVRKSKPLSPVLGRLRMCPFCGLVTPRSNSSCLECGKALAPA